MAAAAQSSGQGLGQSLGQSQGQGLGQGPQGLELEAWKSWRGEEVACFIAACCGLPQYSATATRNLSGPALAELAAAGLLRKGLARAGICNESHQQKILDAFGQLEVLPVEELEQGFGRHVRQHQRRDARRCRAVSVPLVLPPLSQGTRVPSLRSPNSVLWPLKRGGASTSNLHGRDTEWRKRVACPLVCSSTLTPTSKEMVRATSLGDFVVQFRSIPNRQSPEPFLRGDADGLAAPASGAPSAEEALPDAGT